MENQRRRQEDLICEKNCTVPDIIPLTEDNDTRTPTGAPVSDNNAIVDSLLVHPPTESEGDFFSNDADYEPSNYPYPASKIPSKSQPSPPNTSQEGDISLEGAQVEPNRKLPAQTMTSSSLRMRKIWGNETSGIE